MKEHWPGIENAPSAKEAEMIDHSLVRKSTPADLEVAEEAADWLTDAVACATQDRQLLRGTEETNSILVEAIERNGVVACLRAMKARARIAEQREAELVEALKAQSELIERAQQFTSMFLEPSDRRIQTDADLTDAMLGLFDGPSQRQALILTKEALATHEQENQDEER